MVVDVDERGKGYIVALIKSMENLYKDKKVLSLRGITAYENIDAIKVMEAAGGIYCGTVISSETKLVAF